VRGRGEGGGVISGIGQGPGGGGNSLGVVRSAAVRVTALPLLQRVLTTVEVTLLNELSLDHEAHTLHVPLHPGRQRPPPPPQDDG